MKVPLKHMFWKAGDTMLDWPDVIMPDAMVSKMMITH